MERLGYAFGEDGHFVSVWVGEFGSEEAVAAYTLEQYDDVRDDEPLSPFAADIGLRFYNHDFFEVGYLQGLSAKGAGAFALHSNGKSFAAKACGAFEQTGVGSFDTVFLLYGYDHQRMPQAAQRSQRVTFIGTFPYQQE